MNVYRQALDIFRERGGATGELIDPDTGQVCLIGAVGLALGYSDANLDVDSRVIDSIYRRPELKPLASLAREMFPNVIPSVCDDDSGQVWRINDQVGKQAVEQLLEKAAIMEEEKI